MPSRATKNRAEIALAVILRLSAAMLLLALVPVVMPHRWMSLIHQGLEMGELPEMPIVGYLTRSISALYAMQGAIALFISLDIRRYLPFIRFQAVLSIIFGLTMIGIDSAVGIPLRWLLCEGPFIMILGTGMFWLASRVENRQGG
jgi:hypothetical protein